MADECDCGEPPSEAARGWEVDRSFPEVPAKFLKSDLWRLVRVQKWKLPEGILAKESRALVKGLVRAVTSARVRDVRQLLLCDNMTVTFAFSRCRAIFLLLVQIRVFRAHCLARNVLGAVRQVPPS